MDDWTNNSILKRAEVKRTIFKFNKNEKDLFLGRFIAKQSENVKTYV